MRDMIQAFFLQGTIEPLYVRLIIGTPHPGMPMPHPVPFQRMHGVLLHENASKSRNRTRRVVMRPLPGRAFVRETAAIQSALDRRKRNGHPCPQELLMHDLSAPVPLQTFLDDLPDNSLRQSQGTPLRTG